MTLSDPRALADFADLLPVSSVTIDLQSYQQVDGQATGDLLVEDLASPLWVANIAVDWMRYSEARRVGAALRSLRPPRQFYLRDTTASYPAADPDGSILGNAEVTIAAIGADNNSVSFTGLPAGYQLTAGDRWHVEFGANPIRRGYFELAEDGAASAEGLTAELAVTPAIWPGIEVGAAVTLIRPACKMMLVPGGQTPLTFHNARADGLVISAIQRL